MFKKIIFSKKFKLIFSFLIICLLLSGTCLYIFFDVINFDKNKGISLSGPALNKYLIMIDNLNIFQFKKNLMDGNYEVYNLELSEKDILYFDNVSKKSVKEGHLVDHDWRKAKLIYKNEKLDVKIKLKGSRIEHWGDNLKSYKIKSNEGAIAEGVRKAQLTLFEDRYLSEITMSKISNEMGLMDINTDLVIFQINGITRGIYSMKEDIGIDLIEKNNLSNCVIIGARDNYFDDFKRRGPNGLRKNGLTTLFEDEISNLNIDDDSENPFIINAIKNLYIESNVHNSTKLISFFDKNQIATFGAFHAISGGTHMMSGDNLKFSYCLSNGKFYPIPLGESFEDLYISGGGFEKSLYLMHDTIIPIFGYLITFDDIRQERNRKLYDYILNSDLVDFYSKNFDEVYPYFKSYQKNSLSNLGFRWWNYRQLETIKNNFNLIRENLEYVTIYLNVYKDNNYYDLEFIPDSTAQIDIGSLNILLNKDYNGYVQLVDLKNNITISKFLNSTSKSLNLTSLFVDVHLISELGTDLEYKKTKHNYKLILNDNSIEVLDFLLVFKNNITKQIIPETDVFIKIADNGNYYDYQNSSFEDFVKRYPLINWEFEKDILNSYENDYNIVLNGEKIEIDENIIIPSGFNFVISKGTRILIDDDVSLLSYSPLYIEGTKEENVIITSLNESFGVFGVIGDIDNFNSEVKINHLEVSNGNESFINGLYMTGGLAIYNVNKVEIKNSYFYDNNADDGVNIKYAKELIINNSQFENNFADQIDIDFSNGKVLNSRFIGGNKSDNGDGLDISGSEIFIFNNSFIEFKDKGISIGENSKPIIYKNYFENNNWGMAIKDLSTAYVIENSFLNNILDLTLYQKKIIYGGGNAYLYENNFITKKLKVKLDDKSLINNLTKVQAEKLLDEE